jgi:LysR family cys regulon transcriptional activator
MKLLQLRYIVEVNRHGNHISKTAEVLNTSQPGISKHIQMLEEELGFEILSRKHNRIVGLTSAGKEAITIAQRIINDVENLKRLGEEISARENGVLTIATTHTQARYQLPAVIERFIKLHPQVQLHLLQGNPTNICSMVESGEADIAIGTEPDHQFPEIVQFACYQLGRSVITKLGHPLTKKRKISLKDVAAYPIITYGPGYSGRWKVMEAFVKANIEPNIIFGAVDADVSKTYVELGLGIGVLATIAFDKEKDKSLAIINADHLFQPSTTFLSLHKKSYLRYFMYDFIKCFDPKLTKKFIDSAL